MNLLSNNPLLEPEFISKLIDEVPITPEMFRGMEFMPTVEQEGEKIVVDVRRMVGGMTQAVAAGAPAKIVERRGMWQDTFYPAFFKEKTVLGERDIGVLRKLGTIAEYEKGAEIMARIVGDLRKRVEVRIEWLRWQAVQGTVTIAQNDVQYAVDYGIPTSNTPTLTGTDVWTDLVNSDPLDDLLTWSQLYRSSGFMLDKIWFNKVVHRLLLQNEKIRQLRETVYTGGNVQAKFMTPQVLQLLVEQWLGDMKLDLYDEGPFFVGGLTAACAASNTVVVDDATGIEAGATGTMIHTAGDRTAREDVTVLSVSGNTITLTGVTTGTYPIGSSIRTRRTFIPDNAVILMGRLPAGATGGGNWGEFVIVNSAYGPRGTLMDPKPGIFSETQEHSDKDPKSVEQISGFNGLPVMYYTDANVIATVAA